MHSGPEGYLSLSSHHKTAQEISEICVGGNHIRLHLSAIWFVQCTKDLHKGTEASHGLPTLPGTENSYLPGRHLNTGGEQRHTSTTGALHGPATRTVRVHHQHSKVNIRTIPPGCVFGAPG